MSPALDVRGDLPPVPGLTVLVVSDGGESARGRIAGLESAGYRVTTCTPQDQLTSCVETCEPAAVVVAVECGNARLASIIERIDTMTNAVIVVVGGLGTPKEMMCCYEAGADDYCSPHCSTAEIDVRLRALLSRRTRLQAPTRSPRIRPVPDIDIDHDAHLVHKRGVVVPLSPTEFRLLAILDEKRGSVISAAELMARVWGHAYASDVHYLRLYIRYLRRKLEDDPAHPARILNRWGIGYMLADHEGVTRSVQTTLPAGA